MNALIAESAKWWSTIKISWSRTTSFRMDFFLQIIGPSLVLFFVQYNLWSNLFTRHELINGYNFGQMMEYHLWSMVVVLLGQGHAAHDLSNDIRYGRISSYLVYPFDFWKFHSASFLAFQFMQMAICSVTVLLACAAGIVPWPAISSLAAGFSHVCLVSIFWFCLQFLTGIMAFWLEETWILRVTAMIITRFLSGALIPLDFFPQWAREILTWSPFPLLTFLPIKYFTGSIAFTWTATFQLSFWIILLIMFNRWLWKKGVRLYTAAGM